MLHEPEARLVRAWLDSGGMIQLVPFGISGKAWCFAQLARRSGAWGAFKRYGGKHIEPAALAYIAGGQITAAQARVGMAWQILRDRGPMYAEQLARATALDRNAARRVLTELIAIECGEAVANAAFLTVRATGAAPPHWSDYLEIPRGCENRAA